MTMISMETMNIDVDIRPALYDTEVSEEIEDFFKIHNIHSKNYSFFKISDIH